MFSNHTQWTEYPCYYVIAFQRLQRAWLAGPYRTRAEAQAILPHCIAWATSRSGDTAANHYTYRVAEHYNGETRSILGTVNADAALATEALEQGVIIRELREALDGLLFERLRPDRGLPFTESDVLRIQAAEKKARAILTKANGQAA